jgi:DNA-binding CsgD family transcriptional regulator
MKVKLTKEQRIHVLQAHFKYGYTLKEIVDYLDIHYTTVSKAMKNFYEK